VQANNKILKRYFEEISKEPLLESSREAEIAIAAQHGDRESEERLIRSNLRFVVAMAQKYSNTGVPLVDLISAGNLGLLKAVHKFDPTMGFRFLTYAVYWIRQSIKTAITSHEHIVSVPHSVTQVISQVQKEREKLLDDLKREPTNAEIAKALEITVTNVKNSDVAKLRHIPIDSQSHDDNDISLMEILESDVHSPEKEMMTDIVRKEVQNALSKLDDRAEKIIRSYFGIGVDDKKTLEQIGRDMNITRERVRQIKDKALVRLRKELSPEHIGMLVEN